MLRHSVHRGRAVIPFVLLLLLPACEDGAVGPGEDLRIEMSTATLTVGMDTTLPVLLVDGDPIDPADASWSSSAPEVVDVTDGRLVPRQVGAATLTAVYQSAETHMDVRVVPSAQQSLAVGEGHACVLTDAGSAHCWGYNRDGRLGAGDTLRSSTPRPVAGAHVFEEIDAHGATTCARATGSGEVWCWGTGVDGELGHGEASSSDLPVLVGGGKRFSDIAVGFKHACGIDLAGATWCWGRNRDGALAIGHGNVAPWPERVVNEPGFDRLTASWGTCGLEADGTAWCWGEATMYQERLPHPTALAGGPRFSTLAVGMMAACGVATDGGAYCWGNGTMGALGTGTTGEVTPTPVLASEPMVTMQPGIGNNMMSPTCGLAADGSAWCSGPDAYGLFGPATEDLTESCFISQPVPCTTRPVEMASGYAFTAIRPAGSFICGRTTGNEILCWGSNAASQLGTESADTCPTGNGDYAVACSRTPAVVEIGL